MKQRTLLILAISLTVVGFVGLAVVLMLGPFLSLIPAPGADTGRAGAVDAMFIEQMVPHHQDAIDMADLALSRAEHPELRELARRIKQGQTAENEQMRDWYQEWFNGAVPDAGGRGMMGPMMGARTDLERLRSADDFDREFIEQMVPHHQMAIMMARMAGRSANQSELRRLAESMVESQAQEIEDMERWYQEWYGGR